MQYGLKETDVNKIVSVFSFYPEVETAILYGSRAKGNFQTYSDIDVALIGDKIDLSIKGKIEDDLDDLLLPYKMDIKAIKYISNTDLVDHINRVGKVIYKNKLPIGNS
ncbi:hypothetical protein AGMMS50212_03140 [Spirochaetia bacterium]|nr:hypothetical protein AGMMS50212_03140 [Spirochaetia bacterium]